MVLRKKLFLAVFLVSLFATGLLIYNRINVEQQSKSAEIIADYEEFDAFAEQEGITVKDMFSALKDAHFSSVAINEDTLFNLVNASNPIAYDLLMNVEKDLEWQLNYGEKADAYLLADATDYDVVVRIKDRTLFERIVESVKARYDKDFYHIFDEGDMMTIVFEGEADDLYYTDDVKYYDVYSDGVKLPRNIISSKIEDMGLGFDPVKIASVQEAGLDVNLRPANYYKYNSHIVDAYIDDVAKYHAKINEIIFSGDQILSYTKENDNFQMALYDYMYENNIPVGMIESSVQRGYTEQDKIEVLATSLEYNVVRVFPVIEYIQQRYNYLGYYEGAIEVENTLYRAITERNIRAIYFRPFKDSGFTYYDTIDEYGEMFEDLARRLAPHGIVLGDASVTPYNEESPLLLSLSSWGLLVLGIFILMLVFNISASLQWLIFGVGIIGCTGINFMAPNLSIELFALAGALLYPILAIVFLIRYIRKMLLSQNSYPMKQVYLKSIIALLVTGLISLAGGLTVAGIMSRSDYIVEMSYYRGVKMSLILPVLAFVSVYLLKLGYKRDIRTLNDDSNFMDDVKRFLNEDIKMYYFFIAAVVGAIGYVYIARSGHESGMEVMNIEIIFRNTLENVFLARPRTKEILMAYPALAAAVFFAANGWKKLIFPFALVASLGFTSIVNTFCHARTPIYLSVARTFISLAIGIVVSIIVLTLLNIIKKIYMAYFGSKKYE